MIKDRLAVKPSFAGPLYAQVADIIRGRIEDLEWRSDSPLPNEGQLAREMGVSIGTMRKALEALEDEKVITRKQGRGTFIVDTCLEAELSRFPHIYMFDLGRDATLIRAERRTIAATHQEAARLGLAAGATLFEIVRLRRIAHVCTTTERILLPYEMFEGIDEVDDVSDPLLFAVYRRDFHVIVGAVGETISACNATEEIAAALGVAPGQAVLELSRLAKSNRGEPVEWSVRHIVASPP